MTLKAAFIFLAAGADPEKHRSAILTPQVDLEVVGVTDYRQAERVVRGLIDGGVTAVELCGGFGVAGTALMAAAAGGKAVVGAVRFDGHPGLGGRSGDEVFAR